MAVCIIVKKDNNMNKEKESLEDEKAQERQGQK